MYVQELKLTSLTLPKVVEDAIVEKYREEQLMLAYRYKLEREEKEADRKRTEAAGIRDFNLIAGKVSPDMLRWRGIDAALDLAKSSNSKVIIMGSGSAGPGHRTAAKHRRRGWQHSSQQRYRGRQRQETNRPQARDRQDAGANRCTACAHPLAATSLPCRSSAIDVWTAMRRSVAASATSAASAMPTTVSLWRSAARRAGWRLSDRLADWPHGPAVPLPPRLPHSRVQRRPPHRYSSPLRIYLLLSVAYFFALSFLPVNDKLRFGNPGDGKSGVQVESSIAIDGSENKRGGDRDPEVHIGWARLERHITHQLSMLKHMDPAEARRRAQRELPIASLQGSVLPATGVRAAARSSIARPATSISNT